MATTTTADNTMSTTETAYVEQHAAAAALLQQLQDALFDMPAPDGDTPIHWGHVGSVTEITRQLRETLTFVTGEDA
jgi:hypothetical protein